MSEPIHQDMANAPRTTDAVEPDVEPHERARIVRSTGVTRRLAADHTAEQGGVTWMRISDAVAMGSGRVASRGLNLETELVRRIRRSPAVTRRAIHEHTHRLPPLPEFGRRSESVGRRALGRS